MAQDTTEQANNLTLRINAGADYVIQWLVNQTRDAFEWMGGTRPDGSGLRLQVGATKRKLAGLSVALQGLSLGKPKGTPPNDSQFVFSFDDAIEFKVRAVSADRCEMIVSRYSSEVDSYLMPVLESMAKSYPECRPAIDQHLARTGDALPAVDQVKTPAKRGPKDRPEYQRAYDKLQAGKTEERVFAEYCDEMRTPNPPRNFTGAFWRAMVRKGYVRKPNRPRAN